MAGDERGSKLRHQLQKRHAAGKKRWLCIQRVVKRFFGTIKHQPAERETQHGIRLVEDVPRHWKRSDVLAHPDLLGALSRKNVCNIHRRPQNSLVCTIRHMQ